MEQSIRLEPKEVQEKNCLEMARIAEITNGKTCDICFGRGHEGWNATGRYYVICSCIQKAAAKIRKEKHRHPVPHELTPEEKN